MCDLFPGKFVSNYKSRTGVSYPAIIDRREGRGKKRRGNHDGGTSCTAFSTKRGVNNYTKEEKYEISKYIYLTQTISMGPGRSYFTRQTSVELNITIHNGALQHTTQFFFFFPFFLLPVNISR